MKTQRSVYSWRRLEVHDPVHDAPVLCSMPGCAERATWCLAVKTPAMPASGFYHYCEQHASREAGGVPECAFCGQVLCICEPDRQDDPYDSPTDSQWK